MTQAPNSFMRFSPSSTSTSRRSTAGIHEGPRLSSAHACPAVDASATRIDEGAKIQTYDGDSRVSLRHDENSFPTGSSSHLHGGAPRPISKLTARMAEMVQADKTSEHGPHLQHKQAGRALGAPSSSLRARPGPDSGPARGNLEQKLHASGDGVGA